MAGDTADGAETDGPETDGSENAGTAVGMATDGVVSANGAWLVGTAGIDAGTCVGSGFAIVGGAMGASAGSGGIVP